MCEEALQIAEKRREVKGKGERERYTQLRASMVAQMIKNLPTMQETRVQSLGWEDLHWKRERLPSPVFLPGDPMNRGAWWATACGVAESRTWLSS